MSDELLPCPFCGSDAIGLDYKDGLVWVGCACGCHGEWFRDGQEGQAIKAWNTRPDSKPYKHEDFKEWWENSFVRISSSCREHTAIEAWNAARESKGDTEVVERMHAMCEESLDPERFNAWEDIKYQLFSNRSSLTPQEKKP